MFQQGQSEISEQTRKKLAIRSHEVLAEDYRVPSANASVITFQDIPQTNSILRFQGNQEPNNLAAASNSMPVTEPYLANLIENQYNAEFNQQPSTSTSANSGDNDIFSTVSMFENIPNDPLFADENLDIINILDRNFLSQLGQMDCDF